MNARPFMGGALIQDCLFRLIADHLGVDRTALSLDMSLRALGADDLDEIELVILIEQEFDIEIADGDTDIDKTIRDFANLILERGVEP